MPSTPSLSLDQRLTQALGELASLPVHSVERERLHGPLQTLLDEALDSADVSPALSDGRSILATLGELSLPLALHWARRLGPQAWAPTARTPYVLTALVTDVLAPHERNAPLTPAMCDLFTLGTAEAPLLQFTDIEGLHPRQNQHSDWQAQEVLTRFCLDCSQDRDGWKFKTFRASSNCLVLLGDLALEQVIQHPLTDPQHAFWTHDLETGKVNRPTWSSRWQNEGQSLDTPRVHHWMKDRGHSPVFTLTHQAFSKTFDRQCTPPGVNKNADIWAQVQHTLLETEQGQEFLGLDHPGTLLSWFHRAVHLRPGLLEQLIQNAPVGVMEQRSRNGQTLWDAALFPQNQAHTLSWSSWSSIQALLKQLPLVLASTEGFAWHEEPPRWMDAFAQATLLSHPQVWLGNESAQEKNSLRALLQVMTGETQKERTDINARALGYLAQLAAHDPSWLTPNTQAVLWVAQRFSQQFPQQFPQGVDMLAGHAPVSAPVTTQQWLKTFEQRYQRMRGRFRDDTALNVQVVDAFFHQIWLDLVLEDVPSVKKRGPRL